MLAGAFSTQTPTRARRPRLAPRAAATLAAALIATVVAARPAVAQQRDTTRRDSTARDTVARDTTRAAPRPVAADSAAARDTTPARRRGRIRTGPRRTPAVSALPDSLARPPISARRAFLYSLLVPGQGQTSLHRPKAAALFATIEIGTIAMIAKSQNDLRIARARPDSVIVDSTVTESGVTYRKVQDRLAARIRARRLHVEDWMATLLFNHLFSGADAFVAAQLWDLPGQVSFRPMPRGAAVTVSVPW